MNGDGYPDIITPSSVTYTTQRGAYRPTGVDPGELAVTNQDLTFAVSAGIESGLVDIKANAKGKTNATKGGASGKGSDADDSGGGISLGASIDASWTSPNASREPPTARPIRTPRTPTSSARSARPTTSKGCRATPPRSSSASPTSTATGCPTGSSPHRPVSSPDITSAIASPPRR